MLEFHGVVALTAVVQDDAQRVLLVGDDLGFHEPDGSLDDGLKVGDPPLVVGVGVEHGLADVDHEEDGVLLVDELGCVLSEKELGVLVVGLPRFDVLVEIHVSIKY